MFSFLCEINLSRFACCPLDGSSIFLFCALTLNCVLRCFAGRIQRSPGRMASEKCRPFQYQHSSEVGTSVCAAKRANTIMLQHLSLGFTNIYNNCGDSCIMMSRSLYYPRASFVHNMWSAALCVCIW